MNRSLYQWFVSMPAWFMFVACCVIPGCGEQASEGEADEREVIERAGEPDYVMFEGDDQLMNRAIDKARVTYTEMVDALEAGSPADNGFTVKKPYPTPDGGYEHIWINAVRWDGEAFTGNINNNPVDTTAVVFGQSVTVQPDELSDWMFFRDGKLMGGYTLRVMHAELSEDEKDAMVEQLGFEIPAIDF